MLTISRFPILAQANYQSSTTGAGKQSQVFNLRCINVPPQIRLLTQLMHKECNVKLKILKLSNRKYFSSFHGVIETRVEVWKHDKLKWGICAFQNSPTRFYNF